jgi:hypothetical protein
MTKTNCVILDFSEHSSNVAHCFALVLNINICNHYAIHVQFAQATRVERREPGGTNMTSKTVLTIAAALALCAIAAPSMAVPVAPINAAQLSPAVHKVSFGGWPFPYGYAWSRVRACTRYLPVETGNGRTRWQRTWVCSDERPYARRWK